MFFDVKKKLTAAWWLGHITIISILTFMYWAISNWKNMGMLAIIDNPNGVFEEFQSQYNLKRMVEAMKPLTEVQNYLMRHYGMGGTNLSQVVAAWQGDPEVKMLKQQLNLVMRELNSE